MDLGLRDRVCVVSGASRGIGKATSTALAAEGASVLLVGRSERSLTDAARGCRGDDGGRAEIPALEVTTPDAGRRGRLVGRRRDRACDHLASVP